MLSARAAVCALLPSVSENARNSASTEISSAIFLLPLCEACSACSACSICSCVLIVPSAPGEHDSRVRRRAREGDRNALCAWMGAFIDVEQAFGVDRSVNLRGRQRGVAEQFLDGAQIAAARQQMGGERMTQGVRRRAVRQAERT